MFKNCITETPLTSEAANTYFSNITSVNTFQGDISFLSMMRAVMAPRMPQDASVTLRYSISTYHAETVRSNSATAVINAICSNFGVHENDRIFIHNLVGSAEDAEANISMLAADFTNVYTGWHRLENVTTLFQKAFKVLCFIHPERRSTVLFVDNLNLRKLHFLQSAILGIVPWYFKREEGITDLERELLVSCREKTSDKYLECLQKIADQYDFETARIRRLLTGFELQHEKQELADSQRRVSELTVKIEQLNENIGNCLRNINDENTRILGLEAKIESGGEESEIMDYFLCNRSLVLENVTDDRMDFVVRDYITYYDDEVVRRCLDNERSFVYRAGGSRIMPEQMRKLITAVFLDETIKLRVCAAYKFRLNGSVSPMGGHDFGRECREYMPNPHIDRWTCMGNYTMTINQLLQRRDYISALEQTIASAKSLNWTDSTVMGTFFDTLYGRSGYNNKAFELPDGRVVNPKGAIEWLEEQERQAAANEQEASAGDEQTEETQQEETENE